MIGVIFDVDEKDFHDCTYISVLSSYTWIPAAFYHTTDAL